MVRARRVDSGALARRAVQAENMAPPSPRESKAPSATSAAKSDEEMVLPGFPDADSFVKVSSRGLRDTGSRPRPAGSRPRTLLAAVRPAARAPLRSPGVGVEAQLPAPGTVSLDPPGAGPRTRALRIAPHPRAPRVPRVEPVQP